MRSLLVGLILTYQRAAPKALRDRCIFQESCSNVVLRTTRESGIRAAISVLMLRMRRCRPGYFRLPPSPMYPGIESPIRLADGSIVDASILSEEIARSI